MKTCENCDTTQSCGDYCMYCGRALQEPTSPVRKIVYLNGDSGSNYQLGEELGLTGDELREISGLLYELGVVVDIDLKTGEAKMIGVEDGGTVVELERPVDV